MKPTTWLTVVLVALCIGWVISFVPDVPRIPAVWGVVPGVLLIIAAVGFDCAAADNASLEKTLRDTERCYNKCSAELAETKTALDAANRRCAHLESVLRCIHGDTQKWLSAVNDTEAKKG